MSHTKFKKVELPPEQTTWQTPREEIWFGGKSNLKDVPGKREYFEISFPPYIRWIAQKGVNAPCFGSKRIQG